MPRPSNSSLKAKADAAAKLTGTLLGRLPWGEVSVRLSNIPAKAAPRVEKIDAEYNGEDGQTEEEYLSDLDKRNKQRQAEANLDFADRSASAKEFMKPFQNAEVFAALIRLFGSEPFRPIVVAGKVKVFDTLKQYVSLAKEGKLFFSKTEPVSEAALRGMVAFLRHSPRTHTTCSTTKCSPKGFYAAMCKPLIPSAWKLGFGISYTQYDINQLGHILEDDLVDLFEYIGYEPIWSKGELINMRDTAVRLSQHKTISGCYKLQHSSGDADFDDLPMQVRLLLLQLWVYQPQLYTPVCFHNLTKPDAPAEALVPVDIFVTPKKPVTSLVMGEATLW